MDAPDETAATTNEVGQPGLRMSRTQARDSYSADEPSRSQRMLPQRTGTTHPWRTMIRSLLGSMLRLGRTFTPPIGTPNGIAELQPVELNGYRQWLLIRGQDVSNPVLLYLHGGPGEPNMWSVHHTMRELERHFVCVNWDQRGAGRSLRPGPDPATMTIDQFVRDTIALIELLLARFGQQKLFLLGHSWGSVLAMKLAAARPELLHAVIGMAQVVDRRGEDLSYRYVLERARAEHNQKAIRILEQLGGSDTYGKTGKFIQRRWLFHYGGLVHSLDLWTLASILFDAPEYSLGDCLRYLRMSGLRFSIPRMRDELMAVNLPQEIPELSVPVWFFEGRHDYTAPVVLAEEFYASLAAPSKRLVWFEESAHPLDVEEPEKFQRELIAIAEECLARNDPQEAKGESPGKDAERHPAAAERRGPDRDAGDRGSRRGEVRAMPTIGLLSDHAPDQIPASHRDLVQCPPVAALTTVLPDGSPQTTVVWCDFDGDCVRVNTMRGFVKERNMRRNPQVTLLCYDPHQPNRYLEVRGRVVEMIQAGAAAHLDQLASKYAGRPIRYFGDAIPAHFAKTEVPVLCRIRPTHVVALDATR